METSPARSLSFLGRHDSVVLSTAPGNVARWYFAQASVGVRLAVGVGLVGFAVLCCLYPIAGTTVAVVLWGLVRALSYLRVERPVAATSAALILGYLAIVMVVVIGVPWWAPYVIAGVITLSIARLLVRPWPKHKSVVVWRGGQLALQVAALICALLWPDLAWALIAYVFAFYLLRVALRIVLVRDEPSLAQPSHGRPAGIIAGGLVMALLSVVLLGGSYTLKAAENQVDAFYRFEGDLPAAGTLLRVADFAGDTPSSLTVKRILFASTDSNGEPTVASGMVALPADFEQLDNIPVVLWEHGTNGLEESCAPSTSSTSMNPDSVPALYEIAEQKWAVVAPDFMLHTSPNRSPYLVGTGEAQIALDALRAARQLTTTDVLANSPSDGAHDGVGDPIRFADEAVIWGHSQGGHASLWTAQTAQAYAPELKFVGTAAISPAAMPLDVGLSLTGPDASAVVGIVVSYVLGSYSAAYEDVDPNDHLHHNTAPIFTALSKRCTNASALPSILTMLALSRQSNDVFTNFEADTPLGQHLAGNTPTGPFTQPLFIAWGVDDEVISNELQLKYTEQLCSAGVPLAAKSYEDRSHMSVLEPSSPLMQDLMNWSKDRFAHAEQNSTC